MSFHVPELARDTTHPWMQTTSADGNNGCFHLESPESGWRLALICSDGLEWRAIAGWEALYEVSIRGQVRALPKTVPLPFGGHRDHRDCVLAQETLAKGYKRVSLCRDGEIHKTLVHVLVASAFIQNPKQYPEVNHINGDKSVNDAGNLEWCSTEYNHHHAIEHGLRNGLTAIDIDRIKTLLADGMSIDAVAAEFNRSRQRISDIKHGRHRQLTHDEPSRYDGPDTRWEHVSVHAYRGTGRSQRTPNWREMSYVKRLCWDDEDVVMQLHPRQSEYVNNHECVLHLWRPTDREIPTPPAELVGVRDAGVLA